MNLQNKMYFEIRLSRSFAFGLLFGGFLLILGNGNAFAQISPAEIRDSQLKELEGTYFQNLMTLNRGIAAVKFPFPFALSRYAGLDPQQQIEADSRGIEFVKFHERVVLKITGNYNAAYNPALLTQNQRASRAFTDVVVPLLGLVGKEIPVDVTCNAIGFEIAYHVRRRTKNSDYEGKEILVVVFDKADAFGYIQSSGDPARQEILKRSEIYLNGDEFGLALGEREPFNLETKDKAGPGRQAPAAEPRTSETTAAPPRRVPGLSQGWPPPRKLDSQPGTKSGVAGATSPVENEKISAAAPAVAATPADADRLQAKYQSQLDALAKEGAARFHFVDYAPPSFVVFRERLYLQLTLRNPLAFDKDSSSIYKRAAQSFDLFLALQLKALLEKTPEIAEMEGLDITVVNQLAAKPSPSSEAVEFILPLKPLREFVDAGITNQELINRSIILVNGVRIALNLQLVE